MPGNTQEIFKKVFILLFLAIGGLMVASAVGVIANIQIGLLLFVLTILLMLFVGYNVAFHIGFQKLQKEDWVIVIILIAGIIAAFYFEIIPIPDSMSLTMSQIQSLFGG